MKALVVQYKPEEDKKKTRLALDNQQKTKQARQRQRKTVNKGKWKFEIVNVEATDDKVDDNDNVLLTSQTPGYVEPNHFGENTITSTTEFHSTNEYASIIKEGLKRLA